MLWARTNFRVIVGEAELGCGEVTGLGSQTVSAVVAPQVNESGVTAPGATQQPAWNNPVGPWIGVGHNRPVRGSEIPAFQWTLTPVTIRRALDGNDALFAWRSAVVAGQSDTRDVAIQLLDAPGGQPVITWKLYGAWPLSWSGPALDALQPGVALEQAELAYARLQWLNQSQTGEG